MFCAQCGKRNSDQARFCGVCGAAVEVGPATQSEQVEAPFDQQYAGFWIRLVAWIIDTIVVLFATVVVGLGYVGGLGGAGVAFIGPLYFVLLTGLRGQTVGKMAVGVRVIGRDGGPPGLGYALLREIVGKFVSALVMFIGFLWIGWDRQKQGWHDKIATTHVVKSRRRMHM